ncbi:MAG: hypothetical protein JSS69_05335 [Acidobacteria bacterium]|nr:hypothetical protein [Acidobacteriota bacterium]MBS1865323.1 hypothetical protein [Acidobacteriota bacterium]
MGLQKQIGALASTVHAERDAAAEEIFVAGAVLARRAARAWMKDADLGALIGPDPAITVGIAVSPCTFEKIRAANGSPRLANVPPDQDAEEFELHFTGIALDVLTSKAPEGGGAIARYLARAGEGIQQVEFFCKDVDRATAILREKFGVKAVYPETRAGADGTRVNFFLVTTPENEKVLIELYEKK